MDMDTIAVIFCGIGVILVIIIGTSLGKFSDYCFEHKIKKSFSAWMDCTKETLLTPAYYFFGAECPVCKKKYFSRRKAFSCCKGKRIGFNPTGGNFGVGKKICTWCNGTGKKNGVGCDWCGGSGRLP